MFKAISVYLNRLFDIKANHSSVQTELLAGATTFLTTTYIPLICSAILVQAGMNMQGAFIAACLVCCLGNFLTGIMTNYPITSGPGVALLSYFTYSVVLVNGYSWQTALGAVMVAGVALSLISISPLRKTIIEAIPHSLHVSIPVGIGVFLVMIALKNSDIITIVPHTFPHLSHLINIQNLLFLLGFIIIILLDHWHIKGSILISILAVTLLSIFLGINHFQGIVSLPSHSFTQTFFACNFHHLCNLKGVMVIGTFLLVALFNTTGTVIGTLHNTHWEHDPDKTVRLSKALLANGIASIIAGLFGSVSTTAFIESVAGVRSGGRTGLVVFTAGFLFLVTIFFSPLAKTVPDYAIGPILLYIGCLMMLHLQEFEWKDSSEYIPSLLLVLAVPFTFSIVDGIGVGFISYVFMKIFFGKFKSLNFTLVVLAILFLVYFSFAR